MQGWAQPDFWRVLCVPAWLNFSARCFLCLSDACEAAESAHFLSAPSFLPSVPQLQLLPSLLQRPEAPILHPHPPCRLVSAVKLSPPRRMSSAQANLQQRPRSPPPRANLGSAQRWQFSRWDFWTVFLPTPVSGIPGRVFAARSCLGAVHPSALPQPRLLPGAAPLPAWGGQWGLFCAQSTATNRDQHRDHSPAEIPGLCLFPWEGSPPKGDEQCTQIPARRGEPV